MLRRSSREGELTELRCAMLRIIWPGAFSGLFASRYQEAPLPLDLSLQHFPLVLNSCPLIVAGGLEFRLYSGISVSAGVECLRAGNPISISVATVHLLYLVRNPLLLCGDFGRFWLLTG